MTLLFLYCDIFAIRIIVTARMLENAVVPNKLLGFFKSDITPDIFIKREIQIKIELHKIGY